MSSRRLADTTPTAAPLPPGREGPAPRSAPATAPYRPIVVGVDGSAADDALVAWAAREAALRCCELVIVHAWQPDHIGRAPYAPACPIGHEKIREDEARDVLVTAVNAVAAAAPSVTVRTVAVAGRTVPALLDAADQASMLVLGRNRRTDPTQPTLGPVARSCLRQASCPVTTIAPGGAPPEPGRTTARRWRHPRGLPARTDGLVG
ncbi:universal stress protein [Yinghuangia seranimata]|uniref:universal stress protein n=1 Tax=Yinghuangia seranimata TaxID=408067 RepID=UPI00248AD4BC|nr:universal stress protein [Yinghuangia seranimata]MDI2124794.1 universal stress protein [Yinghuangia seranimata]